MSQTPQTTPELLRRSFGIPAEAGKCRDLPRVWMHYCGKRKAQFLATVYSMTMAAALPEEGQKNWSHPVLQADLARQCGLAARSTFTRRLSAVANPVPDRDGNIPHVDRPSLIFRFRRVGAPNRYTLGEIGQAPADARGRYHYPTADDLVADPRSGHLFSTSLFAGRGFKPVPKWVWDHRLPLTDTARLVLTYYIFCGLLDTGEVHPKQAKVAALLGLSVRSIYNANRELADVGLIRVAHPKPRVDADGRLVRGPARIVYLPMRTLTHEEAQLETQRLLQARERAQQNSFWTQISSVHAQLLSEWAGREHSMTAFWRELRRQLLLAGVPKRAIDPLIPRPPT